MFEILKNTMLTNMECIMTTYICITLYLQSIHAQILSTHDIYCSGNILHVVQMSRCFPDSKTFVDMSMKFPIPTIVKHFDQMMIEYKNSPSTGAVRRFVRYNFRQAGLDITSVNPTDWVKKPEILNRINDTELAELARKLNEIWKYLLRITIEDTRIHPDLYSITYLPNPFIITSSHHREWYYRDSYWAVLGLLRCEMYKTAKGILKNFIIIVNKYGFIPNGGRTYHGTRSNMPFLLPMFKLYYDETSDIDFVKENLKPLETELSFWINNRMLTIPSKENGLRAAHYSSNASGPRPEAYRQDFRAASTFSNIEDKKRFYRHLVAACESSWDFSSRWNLGHIKGGNITNTKTRAIVPVELNAILFRNSEIISEFFKLSKDIEKSIKYKKRAALFKKVVDFLWNDNDGTWYDYDIANKRHRKLYYGSNMSPLWTKCYDMEKKDEIALKVIKYLEKYRFQKYSSGLPSSLIPTKHLWDYPIAMPSIQHQIIIGLNETGNTKAIEFAKELASKWIRTNYLGYKFSSTMYNSYHAENIGLIGDNEIFAGHLGYSTTNAVCLDLLYRYGSIINVTDLSLAKRNRALSVFLEITIVVLVLFNNKTLQPIL